MENENNENTEATQDHVATEPEKPIGPAVGTVIIVLILIIGAFYFWGYKLENTPAVDETVTAEEVLAQPDVSLDALNTQSSSDEIEAIEQDISTTDLEGLDAELENIDAELAI
jgi:hypothetical protein